VHARCAAALVCIIFTLANGDQILISCATGFFSFYSSRGTICSAAHYEMLFALRQPFLRAVRLDADLAAFGHTRSAKRGV
jgi:hypothetical protein